MSESLETTVVAIVALLESVGEDFWASQLRRRLAHGCCADDFASLFGGMGSFTDLIIDAGNGHRVAEGDEQELNRQLDILRSQLWAHIASARRRGR